MGRMSPMVKRDTGGPASHVLQQASRGLTASLPRACLARRRGQGSDMATALARLQLALESVQRQIRHQVEGSYPGLMAHVAHVDDLEGAVWHGCRIERGARLTPLSARPQPSKPHIPQEA